MCLSANKSEDVCRKFGIGLQFLVPSEVPFSCCRMNRSWVLNQRTPFSRESSRCDHEVFGLRGLILNSQSPFQHLKCYHTNRLAVADYDFGTLKMILVSIPLLLLCHVQNQWYTTMVRKLIGFHRSSGLATLSEQIRRGGPRQV